MQLLVRALARGLVRTPALEACAVAEAVAADVVVCDFDHQFVAQRLVRRGPLGRPAARSTWRVAGEALAAKGFEARGLLGLVLVAERRGETDMVELALCVVEAEQQ